MLKIPERHLSCLLSFSKLSATSRNEIINYLNNEEIYSIGLNNIPKDISSKLPSVDINFKDLIEVFFSINNSLIVLNKDKQSFIEEIHDILTESKDNYVSDIRTDINNILESKLSILSKSVDLFFANENVITDFRIITDIRPVFNNDLNVIFQNVGIILHNLKISYKDANGVDADFYFTLDTNDLNNLKEKISRAQEKENIIRESISTNLKIIELKD